jgi:2-oxoglutarate ferredoxin oxidoreductase subunit gamma
LAGIILAEAAALHDGRHAVQTQAYGPESRGGASKSEVLISDGEIDYPKAGDADLFLALTQEAADKYGAHVKPGGVMVVDAGRVSQPPQGSFATYRLPIIETARDKLGKPVVANIVALGAIVGISGMVSREGLERAVLGRVPKGTEDLNRRALEAGFRLVEAGQRAGAPAGAAGGEEEAMRSREAIFQVLHKHVGHVADAALLRRAAAEVAGISDEWEEVPEAFWAELGAHASVQCADICSLGAEIGRGTELRLFRRREG